MAPTLTVATDPSLPYLAATAAPIAIVVVVGPVTDTALMALVVRPWVVARLHHPSVELHTGYRLRHMPFLLHLPTALLCRKWGCHLHHLWLSRHPGSHSPLPPRSISRHFLPLSQRLTGWQTLVHPTTLHPTSITSPPLDPRP
jgi:hypothetical protein